MQPPLWLSFVYQFFFKKQREKCLFRSSTHFSIFFFYIELHELFVTLEINPLSAVSFANIFFLNKTFLPLLGISY